MGKKINKKSELKRQKLIQETFTGICESFVSDFMVHNFNADDENVLNSFDKHNQKWKEWCRRIITNNLHTYNTREKREKFINAFEKFVDSLIKKYENNQVTDLPKEDSGDIVVKEPIECKPDGTEYELKSEEGYTPSISDEIIEEMNQDEYEKPGGIDYEEDINDWTDYEPTYIRATLQTLGISTRANTIKGLKTIIDKLDEIQMKSFRSKLGLF